MNVTTFAPRLTVPVSQRDHLTGPETAPVTLLEYGDYECPYCAQAYPVVQALKESLEGVLRFAYRHFPLTSVHPHAEPAAETGEAAGVRGKFWEMHDLLFSHNDALNEPDLLEYAQAIELEPKTIHREIVTHAHAPRIHENFMSGVRSGVNGTPTFFIQGVRYDGPHDFESLFAAISHAAERKA
jgi:protein-disulfide isomerase